MENLFLLLTLLPPAKVVCENAKYNDVSFVKAITLENIGDITHKYPNGKSNISSKNRYGL